MKGPKGENRRDTALSGEGPALGTGADIANQIERPIHKLGGALAETTKVIQTARSDLSTLKSLLKQRSPSLMPTQAESRSEIERLRSQVADMRSDRARLNELSSQNSLLEGRIHQQEEELDRLRRLNQLLQVAREQQVGHDQDGGKKANALSEQRKAELDRANERLLHARRLVQRLWSDRKKKRALAARLRDIVDSKGGRWKDSSLREVLTELDQSNVLLSAERKKAETLENELAAERARNFYAINEAKVQLAEEKRTKEKLQADFNESNNRLLDRLSEFERSRADLELLTDRHDKGQAEIARLQRELAEMSDRADEHERLLTSERRLREVAQGEIHLRDMRIIELNACLQQSRQASNDLEARLLIVKDTLESSQKDLDAERNRSDALVASINAERGRHEKGAQVLEQKIAEEVRRREEFQEELHQRDIRIVDMMNLDSRQRARIEELQIALNGAQSQIEAEKCASGALREQLDQSSQMTSAIAHHQKREKNLEKELAGMAEMNVRYEVLKASYVEIKMRLEEERARVSASAEVIEGHLRTQAEIKSELAARQRRVEEMGQEVGTSQRRIQELEIKFAEVNAALTSARGRMDDNMLAMQRLQDQRREQATRLENERESRQKLDARIAQLEAGIQHHERREAGLEKELAKMADLNLRYELINASLEDTRRRLEEEKARVEAGVRARDREIELRDGMQVALNQRENRISELGRELEALRHKLAEAEARVTETRGICSTAQEQLQAEKERAQEFKVQLLECERKLSVASEQRRVDSAHLVQLEAAIKHYERRQQHLEQDSVKLSEVGVQHEVLKNAFAQQREEADRLRSVCDSLMTQLKAEEARHRESEEERLKRTRLIEDELESARSELAILARKQELSSAMSNVEVLKKERSGRS